VSVPDVLDLVVRPPRQPGSNCRPSENHPQMSCLVRMFSDFAVIYETTSG
jgi:hypothetical protein